MEKLNERTCQYKSFTHDKLEIENNMKLKMNLSHEHLSNSE